MIRPAASIRVAVIISFAIGCGENPVGPITNVSISGRVLDYASSAGVPRATVAFGEATTVTAEDGSYALQIPQTGPFAPVVDGRKVGSTIVNGPAYRGDFLVNPGICVARYGTIADARTHRPISGATVEAVGKRFVTGSDGWYRLDLGCPTVPRPGLLGINTTLMNISHPRYVPISPVIGKGVFGVERRDFELKPQ